MKNIIYRGKIEKIKENIMIVSQLEGYNYGQSSIIFHFDKLPEENNLDADILKTGAFVEIEYNGFLSRSIPAQASAISIKVISNFYHGIIINGEVKNIYKEKDLYSIKVENFSHKQTVILHVPPDAFEKIEIENIHEGSKISAITNGIATMSLPPQMPVYALMPYVNQ